MTTRRMAACVLTIGAGLMLPSTAAAATAPTAVSVVTGKHDDAEFTALIATQRAGARRVRFSGYLSLADHPLADDLAFVVRSGRCSSSGTRGRVLLSAKAIDREGTFQGVTAIRPRVMRRGVSLYVVEAGETTPLACARLGSFASGMVLSARDTGSGQATGIRGLVILRRSAQRVRVTQLLAFDRGDTGTHEIGASGHTCAESFAATDDLWQWRKIVDDDLMDYAQEAWDFGTTESIAVVRTDAPTGPPVLCAAMTSPVTA